MKVYLDTVGCRLNQAEIEQMAGEFRAAGHTIINTPQFADLVVVNSCAVTAAAASDSRQKVRQAQRAGAAKVIFTGCLASLEANTLPQFAENLQVITNAEKESIPSIIQPENNLFDLEPLARSPLPGVRKRTRAFIKAQDGCDNYCTFCVTRVARGNSVSLSKNKVLQAVEAATAGGAHEVVLTGVQLGSWGRDNDHGETLTDLVEFLLRNSSVERLRLSSTEPWDLDERFFSLWQDTRMCPHLHLPLQSGSTNTLKRMARRTTPQDYRELLALARENIQGLAITTDIIVGFPGESDDDFDESLKFVREMNFSGGHVFKYSARPGTAAAKLSGRVHGSVAGARGRLMRQVVEESAIDYAQGCVGKSMDVLWESANQQTDGTWKNIGLTGNYLQVSAISNESRENKIDRVILQTINGTYLNAMIINEQQESI